MTLLVRHSRFAKSNYGVQYGIPLQSSPAVNLLSLTVVILAYNEERHLARAIESIEQLADRIFIIDSGSTDKTVEIAKAAGAEILTNPFVTQAQQFNWALDRLPSDTDWVLPLDAD